MSIHIIPAVFTSLRTVTTEREGSSGVTDRFFRFPAILNCLRPSKRISAVMETIRQPHR